MQTKQIKSAVNGQSVFIADSAKSLVGKDGPAGVSNANVWSELDF